MATEGTLFIFEWHYLMWCSIHTIQPEEVPEKKVGERSKPSNRGVAARVRTQSFRRETLRFERELPVVSKRVRSVSFPFQNYAHENTKMDKKDDESSFNEFETADLESVFSKTEDEQYILSEIRQVKYNST